MLIIFSAIKYPVSTTTSSTSNTVYDDRKFLHAKIRKQIFAIFYV